jgi:hypothetical protein
MFPRRSTKHTNTSQEYKSKDLSLVLEQNLEQKINKARLNLISMMILALCKVKTVNYVALANVFDSYANTESSLRRIQRFMADFDLPMKLVSSLYSVFCPRKRALFWSWIGRIGSLENPISIF